MDLDELAENGFYYGFIAWCILLVYLSLGNGIILAIAEPPHILPVIIRMPDWALFPGFYLLFVFSTVTTENQKKLRVASLLAFVGGLIIVAWGVVDAASNLNPETLSKAIAYTILVCGTGYWFISTWKK
jgi:hypothetical protein